MLRRDAEVAGELVLAHGAEVVAAGLEMLHDVRSLGRVGSNGHIRGVGLGHRRHELYQYALQ